MLFLVVMKIHKGDTVKIMLGKDVGKTGKVTKIDNKKNKVLLDGLNLFKKHIKPKRQGEKGQTVTIPRPMNVSNVMLFCSSCKKPVRIGQKIEGGKKQRICKKCSKKL